MYQKNLIDMAKKMIEPKKIEFETYKDVMGSYSVSQLKQSEPSGINFLSYKKYKITIEEVEESKEVYIERLKDMLEKANTFRTKDSISNEIKKLEKL